MYAQMIKSTGSLKSREDMTPEEAARHIIARILPLK